MLFFLRLLILVIVSHFSFQSIAMEISGNETCANLAAVNAALEKQLADVIELLHQTSSWDEQMRDTLSSPIFWIMTIGVAICCWGASCLPGTLGSHCAGKDCVKPYCVRHSQKAWRKFYRALKSCLGTETNSDDGFELSELNPRNNEAIKTIINSVGNSEYQLIKFQIDTISKLYCSNRIDKTKKCLKNGSKSAAEKFYVNKCDESLYDALADLLQNDDSNLTVNALKSRSKRIDAKLKKEYSEAECETLKKQFQAVSGIYAKKCHGNDTDSDTDSDNESPLQYNPKSLPAQLDKLRCDEKLMSAFIRLLGEEYTFDGNVELDEDVETSSSSVEDEEKGKEKKEEEV